MQGKEAKIHRIDDGVKLPKADVFKAQRQKWRLSFLSGLFAALRYPRCILRTLAVFKIANPKSILRFCGGRMRLSEENQRKALKYCVEGILTGDYLTTTGKSYDQDLKMLKELGKAVV